MPDKDAGTPRVFFVRHGETEWSQTGRYTGITDIELTENGKIQVAESGKALVGSGKLIDPARLAEVFISPRKRAQTTYNLLFDDACRDDLARNGAVTVTEEIAEWGYGKYEGLLPKEINARRKEQGLDRESAWNIWRDGCEDGETPQQVSDRMDKLVENIRQIQAPNLHGENPADVLLIAHGHILPAFTKRWLGYPIDSPLSMMIEPGAIGTLSYQHHNADEPALLLGTRV